MRTLLTLLLLLCAERLGHGVRLHFMEKELHLTGSGGTVMAARVASEAR